MTIKIAPYPHLRIKIQGNGPLITNVFLETAETGFYCLCDCLAQKEAIITWLRQYSEKKSPTASLKFDLAKMPLFTQKVLHYLQQIPFGSALSYGNVAKNIGHPKAARAIGQACGRNPFPFFIPCHRVIAAGNKMGGFSCDKLIKKMLLEFEA